MRITQLSMDGFGIFHDVHVRELPAGLSLFLGANEAGKSTTLAFVHTVLFGYPDGRTREKAYPPLSGGRAGGRLTLATRTAGSLTLERREGKKGGPLTVTHAGGQTDGQRGLDRLLAGTTRGLFRNLYAFSLTEMQSFDAFTSDEIRDAIYGASLGSTARNFPQARKALESRLHELFKPGGSKPEINAHLRELEEVRARLRDAGRGIQDYKDQTAVLTALEATIKQTQKQLCHDREAQGRLDRLVRIWDDWTALQEAERQLAGLPEQVESFPDDGLGRLDHLLQALASQQEELQNHEDEHQRKQNELRRLAVDHALLRHTGEIRALVQGLDSHEKAESDLARAEERRRTLEQQVAALLVEFGAGWTEDRVLALDRSTASRGRIQTHQKQLHQAAGRLEKAAGAVEDVGAAHRAAVQEEKQAQTAVAGLEAECHDVPTEILAALRDGREQFSGVVRDIPRRQIELRKETTRLQAFLQEIGADWTPETLARFDSSLPARQAVDDLEKRLGDAATAEREVQATLRHARKAEAAAAEGLTVRRKELDAAAATSPSRTSAELRARKKSLRILGEAVSRQGALRSELDLLRDLGARIPAPLTPGAGLALPRRLRQAASGALVLALLSGAGLFLAGRPEMALLAGGLLAAIAVVLFMLGRSPAGAAAERTANLAVGDIEQRRHGLESEIGRLTSRIQGLQAELGLSGDLDAAAVSRLEEENDEQIAAAERSEALQREIRNLEAALAGARQEREVAEAAAEKAQAERRQQEAAWSRQVETLRLPSTTSPRMAGLVFAKAENARTIAEGVETLKQRLGEMMEVRDRYLELVSQVPSLREVARAGDDDQVLARLVEYLSEMERQEDLQRRLATARSEASRVAASLQTAARKREAALQEHQEAVEAEGRARAAWLAWLQKQRMEESWSPEITLRLLDRAGRISELAADRDAAEVERLRHSQAREAFRARAAALLKALDRTQPPPEGLAAGILALANELDEHARRRERHDALSSDLADLETRGKQRRAAMDKLARQVRELVASAGADDEETYRRRGRLFQERQHLLQTIANHASNVRKISGQTDLDALRPQLAGQSLPQLEARLAEIAEQVREAEGNLDGLRKQHARTEEQCRRLRDEDSIATLRGEEERLLEEIRTRAADWSRHAIALHLLTAAKERFEASHQPEVIKQAGRFFSSITGGRYVQIFAPHGEETIEVVDARGNRLGLDDLSRGTAEQLYLAIRFGYISAQQADAERLPILMDDVFVNFDPERAAEAARGILELARTHQVLFFTCHPEIVELFRSQQPDVPVYRIADQTISGLPDGPSREPTARTLPGTRSRRPHGQVAG